MTDLGTCAAEMGNQFRAAMYVVFTVEPTHLCVDDSDREVEAIDDLWVGQTFE